MEKGQTNANATMAPRHESGERTTGSDAELAHESDVSAGAEPVRIDGKPATGKAPGAAGQPADHRDDTAAAGDAGDNSSTGGTAPTLPKAGRGQKRLTAAAVKRLRREDEPDLDRPIGELDDEHKAKTIDDVLPAKKPTAYASYNFGYQSGFAAGEEAERELQEKLRQMEDDGVTPRNFKIWQAAALLLAGMQIGMLIGLIF